MLCLRGHHSFRTWEWKVLWYKWLIVTDMICFKINLCAIMGECTRSQAYFVNRFNTAFLLNISSVFKHVLMTKSYLKKYIVSTPLKIWVASKFNLVGKGKNVITLLKFAVNISHLYGKHIDVSAAAWLLQTLINSP